MRTTYTQRPEPVAVYNHIQGTDIFLRRDIREETDRETGQILYTCEEVQGRVPDHVSYEDVAEDFNSWWEQLEGYHPDRPLTIQQQLAQLRADVDYILWGGV